MRLSRALIRLVLALMVALPAAHAEQGGNHQPGADNARDDLDYARMDFVPLRLPGFDSDSAHRLVVVIDGELFGTELGGLVVRRSENRIGLDGIPFLEEVTRFSYSSDMFTPENFAGSVGLVADTLVLNIGAEAGRQPWLGPQTQAKLAAALAREPMIQAPTLGQLSVDTLVVLNDDFSFSIAGGQVRKLADEAAQVPLLGDIPVIGRLFTTINTDRNTRELLVVVTPSIVESSW